MRLISVLLVVAACTDEQPQAPAQLAPTDHLIRASIALRGVKPSLAELRAVEQSPFLLPMIVDDYLTTPAFGRTIRELHAESLLVKIEDRGYTFPPVDKLAGRTFTETANSMYDEPLRLIEDVVMTDQPYTQIVTADYMMADPIVATVWGIDHEGDGWSRAHWPDDRPAAGILVSSAFHLRYRSADENHNRGRANAIARSLLCHDFADSDIQADPTIDLADPHVVANALVENPSCAGCHQTLDPLASDFFSFKQQTLTAGAIQAYPVTGMYTADNAGAWFGTTYRPPAYFGAEADGLAGLGQAIAADPRFARCAAIRFASYLTEVDARDLDRAWIATLQRDFVESGYNAKRLAREIVLSDQFRVAAGDAGDEHAVGYQKVRPQQYARILRDLTGYDWSEYSAMPHVQWQVGNVDYLDDDFLGYRVLMGGIDSFYVTRPVHTMTATSALVVREGAGRAARFVVEHDAGAPPGERTLFMVSSVEDTREDRVIAQLEYLHARIFGELHDPVVDDELAVYHDVLAASGDPHRAWVTTLTAMLSDFRTVYF